MAAKIPFASTTTTTAHFNHTPPLNPKLASLVTPPTLLICPSVLKFHRNLRFKRKKPNLTVCLALDDGELSGETQLGKIQDSEEESQEEIENKPVPAAATRAAERAARKSSERFTYLVAAVMSSLGITSMAVMAVYYRFSWQME
ncbi:beta-carotene 3-hydroxylase chloroplastic, partial [Phtheirospermum japonicum]